MHRANSVRHVDQQPATNFNVKTNSNVSQMQSNPIKMDGQNQHQQSEHIQNDPHAVQQIQSPLTQPNLTSDNPVDSPRPLVGDQGGGLKSYFSDGDFSEVLIKVNDHADLQCV